MGKKQVAVTLRKPPPATSAARSEPDAFVAAANDEGRRGGLDEVVTSPGGKAYREMTVYLPNDLARKLSLHCLELDRDVSNFVSEVVGSRLDASQEASSVPVPPPERTSLEAGLEMGKDLLSGLWARRPWAGPDATPRAKRGFFV